MERDMKICVTMKRTSESMMRMLVTALHYANTGDMSALGDHC